MTIDELNRQAERILAEVERAVVGKRDALELVLLGILADGHVLIEDFPGLAKTLIARSFAAVTGMSFSRIQFTPDLMPADVTGSSIYRQQLGDFEFRPGPIFANLLLADEINRAPPKTQAALLEAMQERQVTIEGETRLLEPPFVVLATQNPIEYEGTYPLPEAQLDRFLLRIGVGYPAREHEWEMLDRRLDRAADEVELSPVVDRATLLEMQRAVENVHVEESLGYYIVDLAVATRSAPGVQVGASPRGSLALLKLARCRAALSGRDFATPDDVKAVAVPALAHRLTLRPELWVERRRSDDIVRELLERVPTPAVRAAALRSRLSALRAAHRGPVEGVWGNREVPPATYEVRFRSDPLSHRQAPRLRGARRPRAARWADAGTARAGGDRRAVRSLRGARPRSRSGTLDPCTSRDRAGAPARGPSRRPVRRAVRGADRRAPRAPPRLG